MSGRVFYLRSELVVRNHETETRSVVAESIVRHTGRMMRYIFGYFYICATGRKTGETVQSIWPCCGCSVQALGDSTLSVLDGELLVWRLWGDNK